jgi:MinD-like ATPase involved in chromosome partitioning or flagellar assembly
VTEPEVALVFTAEPWVEELHRHLTDHGGARIRSLVIEQSVALEESYDVLVVSHRWPALTRAFVADVHSRGRQVLGVHDLAEPPSRAHLVAVDVDATIEADAGPDAFVRALVTLGAQRGQRSGTGPREPVVRSGRLVGVGGPPGVGRTEIAIQLAVSLASAKSTAVLVDGDDIAPSIAQRLGLPVEPNLRTAIDAVEHGHGALADALIALERSWLRTLGGIPNPAGWAQVRPGEVIRVIDRLGNEVENVVVDGLGPLQDVGTSARGRNATAQTLTREADVLVAVCDASPVGVARLLAWIVDARLLAASTPLVVVVNRAPGSAFRRGELYEEITSSVDVIEVAFVPADARVADAAWAGQPVASGRFTKAVGRMTDVLRPLPRRLLESRLEVAS